MAQFALYAMWYNFVRIHDTIKTTPAVAAGIATAPWSLDELVEAALGSAPARAYPLPSARGRDEGREALPGGGPCDRRRSNASRARQRAGSTQAQEGAPVAAPPRPMKQLDLVFDL